MTAIVSIVIVVFILFFGVVAHGQTVTNVSSLYGSETDPIWKVAHAIARAEGYGPTENASTKLNNPGDLSPGDEHGQATTGNAEFHDGSYIIHFATPLAGWTALYRKIQNIVNGTSKVYSPDWTWSQVAKEYAGNSSDWARNVTEYLGVSVNDRFGDFFGV